MSIKGILILILPIVLHIKGNLTLLVFFSMNSIINLLMEYTKIQMGILGAIAENADLIESNIEKGKGYDEGFEEYMSKVDHEDLDKDTSKAVAYYEKAPVVRVSSLCSQRGQAPLTG